MTHFFVLSLLLFYPLFGQVVSSPTIETLIQKEEGSFWLVLDLDNTIFESKEAFGHRHWFDDHYAEELKNGLTSEEAIAKLYPLWVEAQKVNHVQPVEEKLITWIKELQNKEILVLVLTSRQPILSPDTERQLLSLGIDMRKTAPQGQLRSYSYPAAYKNGVIYAHELNQKEEVFTDFLKDNQLTPTKIFLVDHRLQNAEAIEKTLANQGIEVVALHYTAIQQREPVYQSTLANFQAKRLHTLLSNDEALLLLHHQPDIHP